MSNGYSLGNSGLRIWNGAREVFNTAAGKLVNFLPSASTYTFNAAFPDAVKGKIGFWYWLVRWSPPGAPSMWGWHSLGLAAVGARPQKWTSIIVLGDAPPGANMFIGQARLTRTVSPSHTWAGEPLFAPAYAGLWVPVNGSMALEEGVGFARALSIYVADGTPGREGPAGKLVAYLDHSVSGQCGGFRNWGDSGPSAPVSTPRGGANAWLGAGSIAQLVWAVSELGPSKKQSSGTTSGSAIFVPHTRHKWDGSDPPVYSDPTDYSSTYSVEVVGRFGRHA